MKKQIPLLLLLVFPFVLFARQRTSAEQRSIAHSAGAYVCLLSDHQLSVYATPTDGFIVIAADDHLPAIIAKADGTFEEACQNPGFRWWMNTVRLSFDAQRVLSATLPDPERFPTSQKPLIQTQWAQTSPYYNMCPLPDYSPWGGYLPDVVHCAVGCVALAAAQLVNYYQYPKHGVGSHSITLYGQTYTVNFSEATYDWSLMLDSYAETYTYEQAEAVAQLCYHLGVASEMGYDVDASTSDNYYAILALGNYFGYDITSVQQVNRDDYAEPQWMEMIYTELSERRPILYEGVGIDPKTFEIYGHSFLIDGYDADGLVHVNWGWGGKADGYFDISHLDPSTVNFDAAQMMAIGLQAPNSDTGISNVSPTLDNGTYFSVDGMPVSDNRHKIVIHNRKKYLSK